MHLRNRVQEFRFFNAFPPGGLKCVQPCAVCMARWIVQGAAAFDAASGLRQILPVRAASSANGNSQTEEVDGFAALVVATRLPDIVANNLHKELDELGARSVGELEASDWEGLAVWPSLRPFEQRRILNYFGLRRKD